jgi:tight adherence protein B
MLFVIMLLAAGVLAVLYFLRSNGNGNLLGVTSRMGRYGLLPEDESQLNAVSDIVAPQRRQPSAASQAVERFVGRGRLAQSVYSRLDRAQIKMTPAEFLTLSFAVLVGTMALGLFVKGIIGLMAFGIIGGIGPWFYVKRRYSKRRKAFLEQLADMSQMMGNSMKAGFSIMQAFELVANDGPTPASEEFERVVAEIKLGLPLEMALEHLRDRIESEDLELMVVAINVQRQIGGNLAEILMVISNTIRERVRFERDLRTLTAQARYSSYVITALPVAVAVVINLIDRPYEQFLYTTFLGNIMIGVAVVMLAMGFFFLNRIASIEV